MNEERLFHAALEYPSTEARTRYLDHACRDDPALRIAVDRLLVAHFQPGVFVGAHSLPAIVDGEMTGERRELLPEPHLESAKDTAKGGARTDSYARESNRLSSSPLSEATENGLPSQIGRYRVRQLLGRGGMGAVYLGYDPDLDRLVALKVPSLASVEVEERFLREARAAAAVSHPNLCPVYDAGRADGVLYLAMEYLRGPTLVEVLRRESPLPVHRATEITRKVALGMAEAHRHGVIHRDLKPGNILFKGNHEPVVTDFGLALRSPIALVESSSEATAAFDPRLTQPGLVMGTPAYMSPEQIRGEQERMGPASDIYALGAILYELLAGRPAFEAASMVALLRQIVSAPAPLPSAVRPGLASELDAICRQALAQDPSERFASMDAFAEALEPFAKEKRRARRWVVAVLAPLLALAAAAIFIVTDHGVIEIRIDDPAAKVEVSVDGEDVVVTEGGRVTRLRAGPHALQVTGDGFETESRSFKVKRGTRSIIDIELRPKPQIATELPSNRLAELLTRGERLVRQVRFGEVGAVADAALAIDPQSPGALGLRAVFRASRNDLIAARDDAEEAIRLNPEAYRALMVRAHLNAQVGRFDEGIVDLTIALRLDPSDPVAWANRASCYMSQGEFRQVIADASRSIDLGLPREFALLNRGAAWACLGKYDEALSDMDAAAKMASTSAAVFNQRSAIHAIRGDVDRAAADWAIAIRLDPHLQPESRAAIPAPRDAQEIEAARFAQGAAKQRRGDNAGAVAELNIAERLDASHGETFAVRAKAFALLGQPRQSLSDWNEAVRLDPLRSDWLVDRGLCRLELGDEKDALGDFQNAARLQPENKKWREYCLATSARIDGRPDGGGVSLPSVRAAPKTDPRLPE